MPCNPPKTNADKMWPYEEYYTGERDEENRKNGNGMHNWTGAESLESYQGRMVRDTMHGAGDYRWRFIGSDHAATTYEGRFYNNAMHGYGLMSYPDGRVFNFHTHSQGLWQNNIRWGPGVESHACLREDVGLWYGYQLIRLAWRPAVPSVAIDLVSNPVGFNVIAPHRILLSTNTKIIGEVNSAIELLKQYGAAPLAAAEKWKKLYPKNCTDTTSQLCHVESFDRAYYDNQIEMLVEVTAPEVEVSDKDASSGSRESATEIKTYFAWNNNRTIIHMMKHCFTHEFQRKESRVNLKNILSGPRKAFKPAGKHELDCRTILMAAYLGHIANVAQLINESDVMPDVADIQGNSVMMYAACGDQPDIIHFLVEAGADVDAYNDACCTPLGITLLRYALEKQGIQYNAMLQAVLPQPAAGPLPPNEKILEWHINRDLQPATNGIQRSPSKQNNKPFLGKKGSLKDMPTLVNKRKPSEAPKIEVQKVPESDKKMDTLVEDKRIYDSINTEYLIKVAEAFSVISEVNPIPYIFEVRDMSKDVLMLSEEEQKRAPDKNAKKTVSKLWKDSMKPSRDMMWQDKEDVIDTIEQMKQEKLSRIVGTILQLLTEGADPRKVTCPQPPLLVATVSGSADLIRHLLNHGADPDEDYPQIFGYTAIDVAVSGPLTYDNLEVIRTLLEHGADPNRRLQVDEPSPPPNVAVPVINKDDGATLLHAVLARKIEAEPESVHVFEIRNQILELLLKYGCNPTVQYNGHSAVDVAMNKSMDLFDIFIKSPRTDLNAIINNANQTILVKMFYLPFCKAIPLTERLQTLTNLLLFGADPLIKCRNGKDEYGNLFVYVRKILFDIESARKPSSPQGNLKKSKSENKPKKEDKLRTKSAGGIGSKQSGAKQPGKAIEDSPGDYRQTLDLVVECARLLYIRWLQAKLMKELIDVVNKFSHRPWNMILKEHKNKKCAGLWLTAFRCLEIWDVLKTTKKKMYNDEKILKKALCIVHFYYKRTRKILRCPSMTSQEKELIEREVKILIHEHKLATMSTPDMVPAIRPYVTPELTVKGTEKFNVCFECAMPLEDAKIPCDSCNLVSFCSFDCMKINVDRVNCHPCSSHLKDKYFPTPESTETTTEIN